MKAKWLCRAENSDPEFRTLPIPFLRAEGPVDAELFHRWARGEVSDRPRLTPAEGLRSLHVKESGIESNPLPSRHLTMVVSGVVNVDLSTTSETFGPGDILLNDCPDMHHVITLAANTRIVQLLVSDDWTPQMKAWAGPTPEGSAPSRQNPNIKRLRAAPNGQSYFAPFDNLFLDSENSTSDIIPILGFRFVSMADAVFIDWHPEDSNNLVIVFSGGLELTAGSGTEPSQLFGAGDICLSEDRVGQGHIDQSHGETAMVLIAVDDANVWQLAS